MRDEKLGNKNPALSKIVIEPYPHEQVGDRQFEELMSEVCQRPGMYLQPVNYDTFCAYIQGFDLARSGGALLGFQHWLIVRANTGNNLQWRALAKSQLIVVPTDKNLSQGEQDVQSLGRLLQVFFEERNSVGITKIFHDYAEWLLRQSWYGGTLRKHS